MIIKGLEVIIHYPVKVRKFTRWGISKSKVGRRYVKLHRVTYENSIPDDQALIYKDKIIVTPKMYEALKNEIKSKESQGLCGGLSNLNRAGCGTYPGHW